MGVIVVVGLVAAVVAGVATGFVVKASLERKLDAKDFEVKSLREKLNDTIERGRVDLLNLQRQHEAAIEDVREQARRELADKNESYEKTISTLTSQYEKNVEIIKEQQKEMLEATRVRLELESEKSLKAKEEAFQKANLERQAEFKKQAEESFESITKDLRLKVEDMSKNFEEQKKQLTNDSASLKTKFEETVKQIVKTTEDIGSKADNLASALKGQNKMQGCFGEVKLENMLQKEGFTQGVDYDSECYIIGKDGKKVVNEDTGKTMRPDFILHYPDNTDVIVDAKTSLVALSDYYDADTEEEKQNAAENNLKSIKSHVAELKIKKYQDYFKASGRQTIDFVVMFIPNYAAFQLAKEIDPNIFQEAYEQGVLITTEETLMPFLRLIRTAWAQKAQLDNVADIISYAGKMIDRVSIFCEKNAKVENDLKKAVANLEDNSKRLATGNQSIVSAAKKIMEKGVKLTPGKTLPEITE